MDPETRIDIHTQTQRKARSANPAPYSVNGPGPDDRMGQDVSGDEALGNENEEHDGLGGYRHNAG